MSKEFTDAKKILATLGALKDGYAQEAKPENKSSLLRATLAATAFNAASKLEGEVLQEIFNFHLRLLDHNAAAVDNATAGRLVSDTTLTVLTQNLVDHIGTKQVNPNLMPYQYRK